MLRIELPLPPRELSPNARVHWSVRNRATQEAKDLVVCAVLEQQARGKPLDHATVKLTFIKPRRGRRDKDNLIAAAKPYMDGLVLAGVIVDDNSDVIDTPEPEIIYQKGISKTIIEVTP